MPAAPCPHCDEPVPRGTRICHHCLKDIRWSRIRRLPRRARPRRPPIEPRDRRFLWMLRIVYLMFAYTLITATADAAEIFARGEPGAAQWTGTLLLPVVTFALLITAVGRARREPLLWTVLLAGMHSARLFQGAPTTALAWGNYGVAIALWIMAFAAPGVGRRLAGEDAEKYAADDRTIATQIFVVYVGSLVALLLYRGMTSDWSLQSWPIEMSYYYTVIALVIMLGFWIDWPSTWQATIRLAPSMHAVTLAVVGTAAALLLGFWYGALRADRWLPGLSYEWFEWPFSLALFTMVPALFEEIVFRGILWHAIRQRVGPWGTILLTAALFATIHVGDGSPSGALPAQFGYGIILGWLRSRTDSVPACILCHAALNFGLYSLVPSP